jgi:Flp pilus assembly protein TadG
MRTLRDSKCRKARRGTLTVEFALTLPIVFSIFIASLEFSRVNMIRNSTDNAAYEGAREGILPGATSTKVKAATAKSLKAVGIQNAKVSMTPNVITSSSTSITVTIVVPLKDNAWVSPLYSTSKTITKSCKLSRETSININ